MTRRALLALLLALTLVLAGCQSSGGTPADGGPTATPTPTAAPGPFGDASPPPGVDESGVTDLDALMDAHASALDGVPTTVDIRFVLTVNGSERRSALQAKVVPGSDKGLMHAQLTDGEGSYYTADGTTYYKEIKDSRVYYGTTGDVSAIPERARFGADERARSAIASAEWEPVGTVERDGRTLFEFRPVAVEPPNVDTENGTTVSFEGELLVDADGVIHRVAIDTTVETDRGTVQYGTTVALTDVGSTTVDRPDWVDYAEEN